MPLLLAIMVLAACHGPADPEGTTRHVENGVLRVGASDNPPWVRFNGVRVEGVEADLVRELAAEMHARVVWVRGGETRLLAALQRFQLDLVIGGITADTPWGNELGATRPYVTERTVLAVPVGQPVPGRLSGLRVAVRLGDPAGAELQEKGSVVVSVDTMRDIKEPAGAVEDWRAAAVGLHPTGLVLRREQHILVAPPGENRWLLRLDRFLAAHAGEVGTRLRTEVRQ